jgi:conjugative relaxase-like TrwC/TraI family protein
MRRRMDRNRRAMLRLPQQVSAEEFRAIRKGLDPETGEELRCRRVVDRVYHKPWGDEIYRARELYDLTISAPKTVSIQGIVDPRIKEAHRETVRALLPSLEDRCGAVVVAAFEHTYSRKLDPQIHTHLLAANLAHDGEKWRTLHANEPYRSSREITEAYGQELTAMLERWGYKIDYPELADVPMELREKFSQRSTQREALKKEHAEKLNIDPDQLSNREVAVLIRKIGHRSKNSHRTR